jgi:hypothetical protein
MYLRSGSLLARPFDAGALPVLGEAVVVADKVYSFFPAGGADFSVSDKGAVAYRGYAGRSQLAWADRTGRQVGAIGPARVNVKSARLSPDGRWLAAAIYEVERGRSGSLDHRCQDGRGEAPDDGAGTARRRRLVAGFEASRLRLRIRRKAAAHPRSRHRRQR